MKLPMFYKWRHSSYKDHIVWVRNPMHLYHTYRLSCLYEGHQEGYWWWRDRRKNRKGVKCTEGEAQILLRQYLRTEDLGLLNKLALQGFEAAQITLRLWHQS